MSKFKSDKVMPRYFAIAVVLTLIGFAVVGKAMYIMTAKKDYWTQVADRLKRDSVSVRPSRGNILSCDGQLMASSIPEYKVYMDFQAGRDDSIHAHKQDSIWEEKIDTICEGLSQIFPSKTAAEFKTHLMEGKKRVLKNGKEGARHYPIWPRRIDYNTFCEVHKLPIFKEPIYKEVSIGRSSMPVAAHSDHWRNAPLVICMVPRIVRNTVWSSLMTLFSEGKTD